MKFKVIAFINKHLLKFGYKLQPLNKAYLPWPTVFGTVDIAIVDPVRREVLLGKKWKDRSKKVLKDYWVFPGGFLDPSGTGHVDDAVREVEEETKVVLNRSNMIYVGDFNINDERYAGTGHIIRTNLFIAYASKDSLNPIASDDLARVGWFKLDDLIKYAADDTPLDKVPLAINHWILLEAVRNRVNEYVGGRND